MKYDILNDTGNMTVVLDSDLFRGWKSNGAGGITHNGTHFLLTARERHNDSVRGNNLTCYSSCDLQEWSLEWDVGKTEVVNAEVISFEANKIRHWNGSYYFNEVSGNTYSYFSCDVYDSVDPLNQTKIFTQYLTKNIGGSFNLDSESQLYKLLVPKFLLNSSEG